MTVFRYVTPILLCFIVVGVNLTASYLHSEFKTMLMRTEWNKDYLLLLVDDGGLIVTSNEVEVW